MDVRAARFIYVFPSWHTKARRLTITVPFSYAVPRPNVLVSFPAHVFRLILFTWPQSCDRTQRIEHHASHDTNFTVQYDLLPHV